MGLDSARRFNLLYGEVFPEPEVLIGEMPTLVSINGKQKMSESLGNAIFLSDDAATVKAKVRMMYTDPAGCVPPTPARWRATRSSFSTTPSTPIRRGRSR
ncbi:MAG: hypothetical protein NZM11_05855 [Anaerolineales bacterium]|nr:hypothetical protein [Anaerolineales bacterium]